MQFSTEVRNARADAVETVGGASPILRIRTGAAPASCGAADSGSVLATINLPADWMAAASGGVKAKSGTWSDAAADATGTAAHFRIYKADGTTCFLQGTVGTSGADMIVSNTSFATGQPFTVDSFQFTEGNA